MNNDGIKKYDGKRRGWAKFDTRMSNECLGNELLEQLWAGSDVNLPEGTSETQRTTFSAKWFASKFLDLSEKMQKQFVKEQTPKVQIKLAKIGWFKTLDKNTKGAANTEINKTKMDEHFSRTARPEQPVWHSPRHIHKVDGERPGRCLLLGSAELGL